MPPRRGLSLRRELQGLSDAMRFHALDLLGFASSPQPTVRHEPVHLVRRIFKIPERTIFDWLSLYRAGGWDALKEGKRSGRPRKLSADDMQWVYNAVTQGNPLNYQFDFCLWTLNVLRTLIEKERGINLSKSAVSRLLGHLGLSPQRPIYKSYKQDPAKIEEYLSKTFPEAVAQAKALNANIFFVDEASVRSNAHRGLTWGKVGETHEVSPPRLSHRGGVDQAGRQGRGIAQVSTLLGVTGCLFKRYPIRIASIYR
jgi:transposase